MTIKRRVVVLGSSVSAPETVDAEFNNLFVQKDGLASSGLEKESFDEAKTNGFTPDDDTLATLYSLLKPKAKLLVESIPDRETGQSVSVDLKIQGFLDIMAAKDPSSGERFIVCQKPSWETGASAPVKIAPSAPAAVNAFKLNPNDDELIDEDALIDKNFQVPPPNAGCDETSAGKKRACANCTCGLAEKEAADAVVLRDTGSLEDKLAKASGCGGCAKGDAFRCASCPFLGKPAFEPGQERVILAMGNDDF